MAELGGFCHFRLPRSGGCCETVRGAAGFLPPCLAFGFFFFFCLDETVFHSWGKPSSEEGETPGGPPPKRVGVGAVTGTSRDLHESKGVFCCVSGETGCISMSGTIAGSGSVEETTSAVGATPGGAACAVVAKVLILSCSVAGIPLRIHSRRFSSFLFA
jgi:hypothetical protein